jgi:signal transduction histidine kinase
LADALSHQEPLLVPRITQDWVDSIAPTPEYARFLRDRLGFESLIAAPLTARGRRLGLIKFVRADPVRRFGKDDLQLARELARRVAIALDNALLYNASQEAIQAREHVLGVVSHDLRNPLGAIQLSTEAMKRRLHTTLPEAGRMSFEASIQKIENSCKRMRGLIEDVLNLAKLEAGSFHVEKKEVTTESLLTEAFDMLEPLALSKSIDLAAESSRDACVVRCDPERIMQVFSNLVGNAIKFTPEHGRIRMRVESEPKAVVFTVEDNGPGISPEDLPHIFDRFWQANRASRQGAGLGLAIAQGIVEAHGGKTWVESTVGVGTRFSFTLPR